MTRPNHPPALLTIAAAASCLGTGLLGYFGDYPLRTLFWDPGWWNWFAGLTGRTWSEWVTSLAVDEGIEGVRQTTAMYLMGMGVYLLIQYFLKVEIQANGLVLGATLLLGFLHLLSWKEHFWQVGQLLELILRTGVVGVLWWSGRRQGAKPADGPDLLRGLRWLTALTFVGHGLYALGFHPVPAHFVFMTQAALGVGEAAARRLLLLVGWLDMVAAVLLVLPGRRAWLLGLGWVLPWAILTTLARPWSYGGMVAAEVWLVQWLPAALVRLPHVLVPLLILRRVWRPSPAFSP